METKKFGLSVSDIKKITDLLGKNSKIEKVILYGSRALKRERPSSDIDLTLKAPAMSTSELLKIESDLDELLLPYKVDISLYHQIDSPSLIEHIDRVGVEFELDHVG